MLKTNSKAARENLRNYIMEHFDGTNYDIETPETFQEVAKVIYNTFKAEKQDNRPYTELELFLDWCAGLPSILDTCYYYNRPAIDDLGDILNETKAERERYDETAAAEMLTKLIYQEIKKVL